VQVYQTAGLVVLALKGMCAAARRHLLNVMGQLHITLWPVVLTEPHDAPDYRYCLEVPWLCTPAAVWPVLLWPPRPQAANRQPMSHQSVSNVELHTLVIVALRPGGDAERQAGAGGSSVVPLCEIPQEYHLCIV
jgi:hypothetical protein